MHHVIDAWIVANVVRTRAALGAMGDSREARGGPDMGLPAVRGARRAGACVEATTSLSYDGDAVVPHRPREPHRRPSARAGRPGNGERAGRIPTGPFATRG
jgi:hypothetical protein